MRILLILLKILTGAALALLLMELLLTLFYPQERMTPLYEKALGLPIVLRKNTQGVHITKEFSVRYRINSRHLREEELPPEKPDGLFRIVVVGDSFTFGSGVDRDQTFVKVMERALNRGTGKPMFQVINAGCASFGTVHELVYMEHSGFELEPDLVLVAFHDDDPKDNRLSRHFVLEEGRLARKQAPGFSEPPEVRITERIPFYGYLAQHSHVFAALRLRVMAYIRKLQARAADRDEQTTDILQRREKPEALWPEEDWALTSAIAAALKTECLKKGARLAIMHLPYPNMNRPVEQRIREMAEELHLPFLPLIDLLDTGASPNPYYYEEHKHFNPAGHEIIGDRAAVFVEEVMEIE